MSPSRRNSIIRYVAGLIVAIVLLCLAAVFVYRQATQSIDNMAFDAGAESLEETYHSVAQTFTEVSNARWNYLEQIGSYLDLANSSGDDAAKVAERLKQNNYGATDFYLLNSSGQYITLDGSSGYIDLGSNLFALMDNHEKIVADGSLPNRENMIFYAVPVKESTYNGFSYSAVAFGYDKQAIGESLKINSYEGQSYAYMVYDNGRVAFPFGEDPFNIKNLFSFMQEGGASEDKVNSVKQAFESQSTGTALIDNQGRSYYVSYQPAGTQGLMLVSYTPQNAVNKTISEVSGFVGWFLLAVLIVLFLIALGVILFFFRRAMSRRDVALEEKDLIFSMMSEDLDSIYVLFKGLEHEVLYVSPNVKRLLGIDPQEVYINPHVLDMCRLDGDSTQRVITDLDALKPGISMHEECELKNRETGKSSLYSFEMYRPEGKHSDIVMNVISDRSEEERRRQELRDALDTARIASESKSSFLANMSHDIRTPMNAIIGFTTLVDRNAENPQKVREYTKKIDASGKHLLSLINDVLDMSKIEAGRTTLELEKTTVKTVSSEVADLMVQQAKDKNLSFNVELNLAPDIPVMLDKLRLSQILLNILSNAVKYTPEGGDVVFRVDCLDPNRHGAACYTFVVSDNGIGMSDEFLQNIFTSFSREERSVTNKIQGTGLGMAITKNLVDLMGGSINVKSKRNAGSTFTVVLEFTLAQDGVDGSDASEAEQTAEGQAADLSIAGLRILAGEDNDLNAELLSDLMEIEDAQCTIVDNGAKLVKTFESSPAGAWDVILSDVQMPVMNGYEATKRIRGGMHPQAKTIPIIAMTAGAFSEDVSAAIASGMNAHLAKPIDMNALKKTVCEALQQSQADEVEN